MSHRILTLSESQDMYEGVWLQRISLLVLISTNRSFDKSFSSGLPDKSEKLRRVIVSQIRQGSRFVIKLFCQKIISHLFSSFQLGPDLCL